MVFKKSVYFQWRINLENKIYLKQNISAEQVKSGEINGVAYSGAVIPNYMFYKNFIVDLSTLTVAKKKTPIFRVHLASQVAGHYRDWETDRKSTRLNSSHSAKSRMPSSA